MKIFLIQDTPYTVARQERLKSNCPKAQVGAVIVKNEMIVSKGHNSCAPDSQSRLYEIENCPRVNMPTGLGYEICHIVHAEVDACLNIRGNRGREQYSPCESHIAPDQSLINKLFRPDELERLQGSIMILSGHFYACENCIKFTELCGIKEIIIDPLLESIERNKIKVNKV